MAATDSDSSQEQGPPTRFSGTPWKRLRFVLRLLQVRLRFFLVFGAIFLVLVGWRWLQSWRDWTLARWGSASTSDTGVSPDTEYFCPMCPGVLSNWPEKCPVCKMPLVRRHKGESVLLPEGVVARMQLTPYRLQLAGIQTAAVGYEPLNRRWSSWGTIETQPRRWTTILAPVAGVITTSASTTLWQPVKAGDLLVNLESDAGQPLEIRAGTNGHVVQLAAQPGGRVERGDRLAEIADLDVVDVRCAVSQNDAAFVSVGQAVEVQSDNEQGSERLAAVVIAIEPTVGNPNQPVGVRIEVPSAKGHLRPGSLAQVEWHVPLADIEPFRSQPRSPPQLSENDRRELFLCDEHPRYLHLRPGACPFHDRELQVKTLQSNQRVEWNCPAHPEMTSRQPGICEVCGGLPLSPQVTTYSPDGQVLVIPESSVIDSGTRQTVFVESGPNMFDAVPVRIGPRTGTAFPVLSGLEPGQRVVVAGAFLLDAETRLDPSLAASYFGAGPQSYSSIEKPDIVTSRSTDAKLVGMKIPSADRSRIERQQTCPVTRLPLGSMGVPVRVQAGEQLVYLCCAGCRGRVRDAADVPTINAGADPKQSKANESGVGDP